MPEARKRRITYANVTSTLALLIAVSAGTAYANTGGVGGGGGGAGGHGLGELPSDSVGSQQIEAKAVGSQELKNKAVTEEKLAAGSVDERTLASLAVALKNLQPDSVNGLKVADASLTGADVQKGSVPVDRLDAASLTAAIAGANAGTVDGRSAGCASGALEYGGACWDAAFSPAGTWQQATAACATRGGELPSVANLLLFDEVKNINSDHEWVDDISYDSTHDVIRTFKVTRGFDIENAAFTEIHGYRCVLPLLHS
jgi:hypothetical protein